MNKALAVVAPIVGDKKREWKSINPKDYPTQTLFYFKLDNRIRRFCIHTIKNKWFNCFIMLTVLVNTFSMSFAITQQNTAPTSNRDDVISMIENITLTIYIIEMLMRMIASGCWGHRSYFSDNWNILDFIVIVTGIIIIAYNDTSSIGIIRCLRILWPLRTLRSFPGLKILVNTLLSALPALANVAILLAFSYTVFAILGMGIWSGTMHGRCRLTEYPIRLNFTANPAPNNYVYPPDRHWMNLVLEKPEKYKCTDLNVDDIWSTPTNCFWPLDPMDNSGLYCGSRDCREGTYCGSNYDSRGNPRFFEIERNGKVLFSVMNEAEYIPSLNYGYTTFDNVGSSLVIVVQTVTASAWMVLTQNTQDSSLPIISGVYYNLVLFLGMCFLLQINMAIMVTAFEVSKQTQPEIKFVSKKNSKRIRDSITGRILIKSKAIRHNVEESYFGKLMLHIQDFILLFITNPIFRQISFLFTVINIGTLALHQHPMPPGLNDFLLEVIQFGCLMFFILELFLNIFAHGFKSYFSSGLNLFDAASMIIGLIDVINDPPAFVDGTVSKSNPFIAVRALRAIKLAQSWHPLKRLMLAIGRAVGEFLNFLFFLTIFVYMYALLGMELFANKFYFDENNYPIKENYSITQRHRSHFDTLDAALFTVFQIITYDNWPAIMYDGWISVGIISPFYFISIIVFGVWIVMNMFSAITVNSVMDAVETQSNDDIRMKRSLSRMRYLERSVSRLNIDSKNKKSERFSEFQLRTYSPLRYNCYKLTRSKPWTTFVVGVIAAASIVTAFETPLQDSTSGMGSAIDDINHLFAILFAIEMIIELFANGLYNYFTDAWRVLDALITIVSLLTWTSSWNSVNLSVIRSFRCLRSLRPLRVINQMPQLKVVVNTLFRCIPDIGKALLFLIFSLFIFGIACVLFFKGGTSTCEISPYNYLDIPNYKPLPPWFPLNYSGGFSMNELKKVDIMTFPRTWQEMNPSTQQALNIVWNTTCSFTVSQLNDNKFIPTSKQICECFNLKWKRVVPQSFDNILIAMGSLYELTTMEGWANVAFAAVDCVGPDMQPILNKYPFILIFWVGFMIFCSFFMTNLFLGILCDSFIREKYGGFVTDDQIKWINFQRKLIAIEPLRKLIRPKEKLKIIIFDFIHSELFDIIITVSIFLNTIILAISYYGQHPIMDTIFNGINYAFSILFFIEAILKLYAIGPKQYFSRGWDRFDFFILCITIISSILPFTVPEKKYNLGGGSMVVRVFRVGRALRLINKAKLMRSLFDTIIISLPAVGNVTGLLMLMYYIYAAVGVQLFAKVSYSNDMLNIHQNFRSFWIALQTLIGFSTGENWDNFMWELYTTSPATNPSCNEPSFNSAMCGFNDYEGCIPLDGCGSWLIVPYMYSFELIVGYIGLNLFSGILVDAVADADAATSSAVLDLQDFARLWCDYDPNGSCRIELDELTAILKRMPPPFGFRGISGYNFHRIRKELGNTGIMIYDGRYVHFRDVPRALALRTVSLGDTDKYEEINMMLDELGITKDFYKAWGRRYKKGQETLNRMNPTAPVNVHVAGMIISRWHRRHKRRHLFRQNSKLRDYDINLVVSDVIMSMCSTIEEMEMDAREWTI